MANCQNKLNKKKKKQKQKQILWNLFKIYIKHLVMWWIYIIKKFVLVFIFEKHLEINTKKKVCNYIFFFLCVCVKQVLNANWLQFRILIILSFKLKWVNYNSEFEERKIKKKKTRGQWQRFVKYIFLTIYRTVI